MQTPRHNRLFILSLLGALSVISPFAIDMYLPAFPEMAKEFSTDTNVVSLSLSSYFIGLAFGQLFYGPFLDRFGRRPPLCFGLVLFILATAGCYFTHSLTALLALRFIQAVGGCAAQVGSVAMVHDFFPTDESAKIFSMLFLYIGVSPLLAPSVGSLIIASFGWKMIFLLLGIIVTGILALIFFKLPESHKPDKNISLKPGPILREFLDILKHPRFSTYALAGAFSFAGLFVYVAGSPIIFMDGYRLSAREYGGVFAVLTMGFLGSSQLNVALLKIYSSERIFLRATILQTLTGALFTLCVAMGWCGFAGTLLFFFFFLACAGVTYPNAAALALEPFSRNAGSASALLGFLQLGVGALISTAISVAVTHNSLPIIAILGVTSVIGLFILLAGYRRAQIWMPEA